MKIFSVLRISRHSVSNEQQNQISLEEAPTDENMDVGVTVEPTCEWKSAISDNSSTGITSQTLPLQRASNNEFYFGFKCFN